MHSSAASVRRSSGQLPVQLLILLVAMIVVASACSGSNGDSTSDAGSEGVASDEGEVALPVLTDDDADACSGNRQSRDPPKICNGTAEHGPGHLKLAFP